MNKFSQFFSMIFILALSACGGGGGGGGGPGPSKSMTASQYFTKTAVGNSWEHWFHTTMSVQGQPPQVHDTVDVSTITSSSGGVVTYTDIYTTNGFSSPPIDSIWQIDSTGALIKTDKFGPPRTELPAIFSVGTTWVSEPGDPAIGFSGVNTTIVAFNVTRTVPAGTFTDCLQISYTWSYSNDGFKVTGNTTAYVSASVGNLVEETGLFTQTSTINGIITESSSVFNSKLHRYNVK